MQRQYDFPVFCKDDHAKRQVCTVTISARNMGEAIEYIKCMTPWDIVDPYEIWTDFNPKKRRSRTMTAPTVTKSSRTA